MKKYLLLLVLLSFFSACSLFEDDKFSPDENEPNDTKLTAESIDVGDSFKASITNNDIDYFSYSISAYQDYEITIKYIDGDLDPVLYIFDTDGSSLGYVDEGDTEDNETFSYSVRNYTGEIYIAVSGYWTTDKGDYKVRVTNITDRKSLDEPDLSSDSGIYSHMKIKDTLEK